MKIGIEDDEERYRNDAIIDRTLHLLYQESLLSYQPFDGQNFYRLYKLVNSRFIVFESSITTRMARLLFGISTNAQPKNVLIVGSYLANSLVWLAYPLPSLARVIGVDVNNRANEIARKNLDNIGLNQIDIVKMDGHDAGNLFADGIDLLLLDADGRKTGKKIYQSLLQSLFPFLNQEALVLAHDVCYTKFKDDLITYIDIVSDRTFFKKTIILPVDSFGLGVSKR